MLKRMMRLAALAAGLGFFGVSAAQTESYGLPENIQDGNILHLFCWSSPQIRTAIPSIAEAGFTAIQISPVQGNAHSGAEWFYAYMPYDFAIKGTGAVNNADALKKVCEQAHKYGVKVIVDVVANHINGATVNRDAWWNTNDRLRPTTSKVNYASRTSITQHRMGDYPDVNSESAEVQERAKDFVQALKDCGVDGIRWDAAKHIALPSENCDFWKAVTSVPGLYHYGEILDSPGGSNANGLMKEYTDYMSVTDNTYSRIVLNAVKNGTVPTTHASWASSTIADSKVVYWGESHDTYANDGGETKNVTQERIDRAWAIVACRAGASSLYLSRPSQTGYREIKMGVQGSTHFTAPEIAAVNHFRNAMVGKPDYYTASGGVACITRKNGGAVIVVGNGGSKAVSVENGGAYCPPGIYVDKISGNTFTVTASKISGTTGPTGIAVLYDGVADTQPRVTFSPEGGSFKGETLDVKAELVNAVSGTVAVSAAGIAGYEETLAPGVNTLTIGAGVAFGETITLRWSANAAGGAAASGEVTYTKVDPSLRPADMPSEFYILGQVNGNSWDPSIGVKMDEDGSSFVADVTIQGAFSFASAIGAKGNWSAFNASGVRYGATGADVPLAIGGSAAIQKVTDPKAYTFAAASAGTSYTIAVDWDTMTVSVREAAGVDGVTVEDAAAQPEYYTLQGIRVDEPSTPGLYIVRRGRSVSKVYIR